MTANMIILISNWSHLNFIFRWRQRFQFNLFVLFKQFLTIFLNVYHAWDSRYETGNHIYAQEEGYLKTVGDKEDSVPALVQQGSYSYTAPDGQVITVEYTADEFGFKVKGDHIPTPPPVSPEIQKGLDLIYAGIRANQVTSILVG